MAKYDVFLSHNSVDKPWVMKLKEDLRHYKISVWLDRDEIRPGDVFAKALEDGLANSQAMALIISPEAINSGWVEEEYYRALSLSKTSAPLQLIPVLLRTAQPPGFIQSRSWVDFRNDQDYAKKVWELVWGITGQKPPAVKDLSAPVVASVATESMTSSDVAKEMPNEGIAGGRGMRTGGVQAGRDLKAENIVTGVQIKGGDAETAQHLLALTQRIETGSVEAAQDLIAGDIVTGFSYMGQGGSEANRDQLVQELTALRQLLQEAIDAGEIQDTYEAEDAQRAVDRAIEQTQIPSPVADNIATQLGKAANIITQAATVASSTQNFGAAVIKLAPLISALKKMVMGLF